MIKFNIKKLRNRELLNYLNRILEIIIGGSSEKLKFPSFNARLTKVINSLVKLSGKISTNFYTDDIEEKDALRDRAFIAFRGYIEVCTKRMNVDWNADAYLILDIIKNNNWNLYKENYDLESGSLSKLFIDLERTEVTQAIDNIQATEWLHELKIAENNFIKAVETRDKFGVSNAHITKTNEIRNESKQVITDIWNYADVLKRMSPSTELTVLELRLNELNKDFANRIAIREGRRNTEKLVN